MERKKRKRNPVHCRVCGGAINRDVEIENVDWIMPSRNYFYHKKCYEDWKSKEEREKDEFWIDMIYDYIARDLKIPYNYFMCEKQRMSFVKRRMTNKGIYFALKWFIEVKKGSMEKSNGGIGIIPYIYEESCNYWIGQEKKHKGFLEELEQQLAEAAAREKQTVYKKKNRKKTFKEFDLSDVGDDE